MIKVLLFDFSRTLLFPKDISYAGDLNPLHKELSQKESYNFLDYFELNGELLKFLTGIKDKYKLYIFTSGTIQNAPEIKSVLDEVFDGIYSSEDIGFSKIDPNAYEYIAENLNVKPQEILFVDDSQANLETADLVGCLTLKFEDNEKTIREIKNYIGENIDKSKFAVDTYNKIAGIYTKQYFSDITDTPYIDKFLEKLPEDAKILDVGSGPGQFSKYIVSKGYSVCGIDLSEEMVKIAKEKAPEANFEVMDMRDLKYKDDSFDGLLVSYSLIHIPSNEIIQTLKGFYRVLKRDGYIMVIVQKGDPDRTVDEPLMKGEKTFINFFTKEKLRKYLSLSGFKIEFIEEKEMKDPDGLSDRVIYVIGKK